MSLPEQVVLLSDAATEVWDTASAGGWSPSAALDTLGSIEVLLDALNRLGPPVRDALAPALTATTAVRALIAASLLGEDHFAAPAPVRQPGPQEQHRQPEYWVHRDMRVAETLWMNAQEGRGGELADMFAALPPQAMIEAMNRRGLPQDWRPLLEELTRWYGPHRPRPCRGEGAVC
ncbi:hypothetical protein DBP19_35045 [Streptomyces sp. CS090A]|uniref:hypothetical protein n=1 Tax=Streptomyces sp. CS090A TaxID=2162710 RepID=UPI000D519EB5|nr:hypothetical protein [Streptomyces sp. CS090A]PVC80857.1 hypothetical protein DBP19_35045 [Streptomyces sp. CS090A]